jgi:PGF-pre-PGF domain-containing protein
MRYCIAAVALVCILLLANYVYAAQVEEAVYSKLENSSTVSVIVELKEIKPLPVLAKASEARRREQFEARKQRIRHAQESVMRRLGLRAADLRMYSSFNAFAGNVTASTLQRLEKDGDVANIYLSRNLHVQLNDTVPQIGGYYAQALTLNNVTLTGKGQTVCVIDTGIDYNHPSLGGGLGKVVLGGYDFVNNDEDPMDDHSHGTHIAGIIASNDTTYRGVAPGAKLIAIKVCDGSGNCNGMNMIAGADWCIYNASKFNISVITISIGDGGSYYYANCPSWMDEEIDAATSQGIAVTISSGNDFHKYGISYPACSANAIAVGAVGKASGAQEYSNSGSELDLLAPGGDPGNRIRSTYPSGAFGDKYGTSMAAPHVAAAIALLQQFSNWQDHVSLSPAEALAALHNTGINVTDQGNGLAFPLINVYAAILSLDDTAPIIQVDLPTDYRTTNSTYNIKASSNEALSVAKLWWDGSNFSMEGHGVSWNYTAQGNGVHLYRVFGNDSAGNIGYSSVHTLMLNDSPPVITSFYPLASVVNIKEPLNQTFNISFVEPNGQNVTVKWSKNKTVEGHSQRYTFAGSYNSAGTFNVTVVANDSYLVSTHSWILTVNNTNRIPTVAGALIIPVWPSINSNLVCDNLSASDADGDSIQFFYDWYNGNWRHFNSKVLGRGNLSLNSKWNCSVIPNDGHSNGSKVTSVQVTANNTLPNITSYYPLAGTISIKEPANQTFNVTVFDAESSVTITWLKNSTNQSSSYNHNSYRFQGSYNSAGSLSITAAASDGSLSSNKTWLLQVNNTNRAPRNLATISNQRVYRNRNVSINLSLYFSDDDNEPLTFGFSATSNISIVWHDTNATIVPARNWTGTAEFFFNCSDGYEKATGNRFNITFTDDLDGDGYLSILSGGDDCNDLDAGTYPGASCVRDCYTGSKYDYNCACTGGTYACAAAVGGGGGGPILVRRENASSRYFDIVQPGVEVEVQSKSEQIAATRAMFKTLAQRSKVTIIMRRANPSETIENAYDYFEITHENLEEDDFSEAEIEFRVRLDWLDNYDKKSVTLNRYSNNHWEAMPTLEIAATAGFVFYRATGKGLSLFAITAMPISRLNSSPGNVSLNETQQKPAPLTENPQPAIVAPQEETPRRAAQSFRGLIIVMVIGILACVYVSYELQTRKVRRLEMYIDRRLRLGHKDEDIKNSLLNLGWPSHAVKHHIVHAKQRHLLRMLEHQIAERLSLGHSEEDILKSLASEGLRPRHIRRHTKKARRILKELR